MQQEYLEQTRRELRLRNYSLKTIKAYLGCLKEYFNFQKINLEKIDEEKIKQFLLNKQDKDYSSQTINLYLNAIKFFYREVLKIPEKINLKFAKRSKKLPIVLSREKIKNIIEVIRNPKHKLIISLACGAGLRISEVVNLKVKDVNLEELTIHLKNAKGKKDRITIFPEKIKTDLQNLLDKSVSVSFGEPWDFVASSLAGRAPAERRSREAMVPSGSKNSESILWWTRGESDSRPGNANAV